MKLKFDINRENIFDSYLNGELSEEENEQFLESINADERLQQDFEAHKLIHQYFTSERQNHLKQVLNDHRSKKKFRLKKSSFLKISTTIAACLCGIIFLGNLIFGAQPSAEELYSAHFESYQNVYKPTLRGFQENTNLNVDSQLMKAYDNEEYAKMIQIYESNSDYLSNQNALSFYSAIAYMKVEKVREAKTILEKITADSKFRDQSQWYLALCYLNENNLEEFKKITRNLKYKKAISDEIIDNLE